MLVVYHNEFYADWHIGHDVQPIEYPGDVIVAFDPSKTNLAMVVGTPDKQILDTIEFSGNNRRRGPAMDTTVFCQEVRSFLSTYLSKVNLYCVGVEQALTYKTATVNHNTNMVLTEIRSNILNFFLEHFGVHVIEVNNWSWKYAVLPEGYRSKYEKGSKLWFTHAMPDSPYSHYFEADMTDCICIYWYLVDQKCSGYSMFCTKAEPCSIEYKYYYYPVRNGLLDTLREVKYNPVFSVKENLDYYVNRIMGTFTMLVDVDRIDISDVYGHANLFTISDINCNTVRVVATRACR